MTIAERLDRIEAELKNMHRLFYVATEQMEDDFAAYWKSNEVVSADLAELRKELSTTGDYEVPNQ